MNRFCRPSTWLLFPIFNLIMIFITHHYGNNNVLIILYFGSFCRMVVSLGQCPSESVNIKSVLLWHLVDELMNCFARVLQIDWLNDIRDLALCSFHRSMWLVRSHFLSQGRLYDWNMAACTRSAAEVLSSIRAFRHIQHQHGRKLVYIS